MQRMGNSRKFTSPKTERLGTVEGSHLSPTNPTRKEGPPLKPSRGQKLMDVNSPFKNPNPKGEGIEVVAVVAVERMTEAEGAEIAAEVISWRGL